MTCQECERLLAGDERSPAAETHAAQCAECRALFADLQANAAALRGLRDEPGVAKPRRMRWTWAAAAAVLALILGWSQIGPPSAKPPAVAVREPRNQVVVTAPPRVAPAIPPVPVTHPKTPPPVDPVKLAKAEPLTLKILTDDPDVVIYWLVDPPGNAAAQ